MSERNADAAPSAFDDSIIPTRSLEAFGRKVTATAGHLLGDGTVSHHYHNALGDLHRELRHPLLQRQVFSLAQSSPREFVRSKLSTTEIQHRALTYLPDELLVNVPENHNPFSLFQGFQASLPETEKERRKKHNKRITRGRKLSGEEVGDTPLARLRNEKNSHDQRLEMMEVRKNMCSTEIREIDNKIANLNTMRKIVLDRLADLEQEETQLEHDAFEIDTQLEALEEEIEDNAVLSKQKASSSQSLDPSVGDETPASPNADASFMSESIYEKLPPSKAKRPKPGRRKTTFILHEHLQAGSKIRDLQAHNDTISALDFDVPFGTMVTAALDDTVRVWDLNAGRCMGLLEGHLSSVRCLQVEDNIVATGSMDASVRLWDLSQADYTPQIDNHINKNVDSEDSGNDETLFSEAIERAPSPPQSSMADCALLTLSAHVAEISALHFHNSTLISGSADKTLRQWDLEKGRCVQTLDVLWAAAQASSTISGSSLEGEPTLRRQPGRAPDANADFVGALQVFDAALACGTADGMVRLWDLRSGQVHRSLVGHTGPVTCLQFDDVHLVTGSADRSIRIWDLRTGSIFDAYAYDNPVTSMMFDARRIATAAGHDVVKVYDKTDGKHWDCGAGAGEADSPAAVQEQGGMFSIIERVRIKDGYMIEGRKDGMVGVWSC